MNATGFSPAILMALSLTAKRMVFQITEPILRDPCCLTKLALQ